MKTRTPALSAFATFAFLICCSGFAQGTAFTYQGRLNDAANPANGVYDLRFAIYDSTNNPGTLLAGPITNASVAVSNGLFAVTLDFGNSVFTGADRWLEIGVRSTGGGTFTTLNPRQKFTATPYAIAAANLTGTLPSSQLTGPVPLASLPAIVVTNGQSGVNFTGTFSGNGAGVTNVGLGSTVSGGALNWGYFVFGATLGAAAGPVPVAAGDFNGDGRIDLVCANRSANTLTVFTNNGGGNFVIAASLPVGTAPEAIAVADVNGDGKLDLICANSTAFTVSILTNNGNAGFVVSSTVGVGTFPYSVAAADVNGDGKVDLITANLSDGDLTVLTNDGSGGFVLNSSPSVGPVVPEGVTAADVNGDGKMDLISANYGSGTLTVLTNDGTGHFVVSATLTAASEPTVVVAADVNGDGRPDLITSCFGTNVLMVFTNNGSGGFAFSSAPIVGNNPFSVAAADVNGDGKIDLISANQTDNTVTVLTNNGSGGFTIAGSPAVGNGPEGIVAADLNGDGKPDLVNANFADNTLTILINRPGFIGNGTALTDLSASQVTSGTLSDTRLSANVALRNATQTFTGPNTFNAATAFNSGVTINPPSTLSFGTGSGRQMLNLWSTVYGIGIQSYAQYYRVDAGAGFFWYESGIHSDTHGDPGAGGSMLMSLESTGQLTLPGLIQNGVGTGTGEPPDRGIILRRVHSTVDTLGSVVARTDKFTLERDGSFGGLRIVNVASPGESTIAATGVTSSGTTVNFVLPLASGAAAGTNTVFSNAQNVIYLRCTLSYTGLGAGHSTEVSLTRAVGDATWVGTLTSTYNQ
jgi:hypothetical protein